MKKRLTIAALVTTLTASSIAYATSDSSTALNQFFEQTFHPAIQVMNAETEQMLTESALQLGKIVVNFQQKIDTELQPVELISSISSNMQMHSKSLEFEIEKAKSEQDENRLSNYTEDKKQELDSEMNDELVDFLEQELSQ